MDFFYILHVYQELRLLLINEQLISSVSMTILLSFFRSSVSGVVRGSTFARHCFAMASLPSTEVFGLTSGVLPETTLLDWGYEFHWLELIYADQILFFDEVRRILAS